MHHRELQVAGRARVDAAADGVYHRACQVITESCGDEVVERRLLGGHGQHLLGAGRYERQDVGSAGIGGDPQDALSRERGATDAGVAAGNEPRPGGVRGRDSDGKLPAVDEICHAGRSGRERLGAGIRSDLPTSSAHTSTAGDHDRREHPPDAVGGVHDDGSESSRGGFSGNDQARHPRADDAHIDDLVRLSGHRAPS